MECFIVPLILIGLLAGWWGGVYLLSDKLRWNVVDNLKITGLLTTLVFGIAVIIIPAQYYTSGHANVVKMETYYRNSVEPYIVAEYDDHVEITNYEAGLWQAGSMQDYNNLLRSNRYWDSVSIIKTFVYPAPDYLKEVRIASEEVGVTNE